VIALPLYRIPDERGLEQDWRKLAADACGSLSVDIMEADKKRNDRWD